MHDDPTTEHPLLPRPVRSRASRPGDAGTASGHEEFHRTAVCPVRSPGGGHRAAAAGSGGLPGPFQGGPPASTPTLTCAATWPGAPSVAWIRQMWPSVPQACSGRSRSLRGRNARGVLGLPLSGFAVTIPERCAFSVVAESGE
jgi:hypothetical protein